MPTGGWGDAALALMAGQIDDRAGGLGLRAGGESADAGDWRCWLWGRLDDSAELDERFGGNAGTLAAVARAHVDLGAGAAELLRGCFVLLALDHRRGVAYVSRDRLGGLPLVYVEMAGGALFAEHEVELLDLLPRTPEPDALALCSWVDVGTLPGNHSLYAGIRRLPPAHRLVLSAAPARIERYWEPAYSGLTAGGRGEATERLREEVFAAVARSSGEAARPALRLSGGLDSAAVAAGLAVRRGDARPPVALSAVFPDEPDTDESELIELTARDTGCDLRRISINESDSLLVPARRHLGRWRLPPFSPNVFIWERVMACARELGVDALLDGEGGDELFGLTTGLVADRLRCGRIAAAWGLSGRIPGMGHAPGRRLRLRALRVFGVGPLLPPGLRRRRRRSLAAGDGSLLRAADHRAVLEVELAEDAHGESLDGPLWWRRFAAELTGGGEDLGVSAQLRREALDGGVERRHPFLFDLGLVERVLATPPQEQFDPVLDRPLLREALDGRVPAEVLGRPGKSYFSPLLVNAMAGAEGEDLAAQLGQRGTPLRGFVDPAALDRMLVAKSPLAARQATALWRAGMADAWLRGLGDPGLIQALWDR